MKPINIQRQFRIPDHIVYIATNPDGTLVAFVNAPIRDYEVKLWRDCVTGDYGEIIPYENWELSVRKVDDLQDMRNFYHGPKNRKRAIENSNKYKKGPANGGK